LNELCGRCRKTRCKIVFYDNFVQLCEQRGVKPTRAAMETGIARSAVSHWKASWEKGIEVLPSNANAKALAVYFGVTVDRLLSLEQNKMPAAQTGGGLENDPLAGQLIAAYGEVREEFTQDEIDDVTMFIRMVAARKRQKREKEQQAP